MLSRLLRYLNWFGTFRPLKRPRFEVDAVLVVRQMSARRELERRHKHIDCPPEERPKADVVTLNPKVVHNRGG